MVEWAGEVDETLIATGVALLSPAEKSRAKTRHEVARCKVLAYKSMNAT